MFCDCKFELQLKSTLPIHGVIIAEDIWRYSKLCPPCQTAPSQFWDILGVSDEPQSSLIPNPKPRLVRLLVIASFTRTSICFKQVSMETPTLIIPPPYMPNSTWNPKVCRIKVLWMILSCFGRYSPPPNKKPPPPKKKTKCILPAGSWVLRKNFASRPCRNSFY